MSTYKISIDQFLRLATVIQFFESNVSEATKNKINTIRIENKGGNAVAVVTNQKVASVENLGRTDFGDGICHLKVSPEFIDAAKRAVDKGIFITITVIPEIAIASAQVGNTLITDACQWIEETPLDKWRTWINPPAEQSSGIMSWDLFHIETLLRCSPSGKIVFPEFIDSKKPLIVRDSHRYNDWLGIFIPNDDPLAPDVVHTIKGRYMPDWLK